MTAMAEWIRNELERGRRETLDAMPIDQLRQLWDELPDDGGPLIKGNLIVDCDDIHAALNRRGDGAYCAV